MDIDSMTPDELRRRCRELLLENETLRRRLAAEENPARKGPSTGTLGAAVAFFAAAETAGASRG